MIRRNKCLIILASAGVMFGYSVCQAAVESVATDQIVSAASVSSQTDPTQDIYQQYMECLDRVYKTMDENYFRPVRPEDLNRFKEKFDKDIYGKIEKKDEKSNFVCWRSAAFLVDALKDPQDSFSAFLPPKEADKFEKKVLGEMMDLGITGELIDRGYRVKHVEPRSDAYAKGLREDDVITLIDSKDVLKLTTDEIQKLLTPLVNSKVTLRYIERTTQRQKTIRIVSQEYYKQSVFMIPVNVPGIMGLEVRTFNRKTGEDLFRYLSLAKRQKAVGLIIDLRGNPGGPPLAAQEISGFFLPAGNPLAYFQKKGQPKAALSVPKISENNRFSGPIVILVNKDSGSSSELFSGVLQKYGRAVIMGTNTAGKVFLKSMFRYDDNSMLYLITARGHFPDGSVFDFNGVSPDVTVAEEKADLVQMAADFLLAQVKSAGP